MLGGPRTGVQSLTVVTKRVCNHLSTDPQWPPDSGPRLPWPLMMAADSPRDLTELVKIMLSRVCNLLEGADAIMLGIIRINYMSRKTITMH